MNYKDLILFLSAFLCFLPYPNAQRIMRLETKWLDSFREWTFETDSSDIKGSISATWALSDDWTDWQFEFGEYSGTMKLKFPPDQNLWEFRSGNEVLTARTMWSNDLSEWRFSDGERIIQFKLKRDAPPFFWFSEGDRHGFIDIYTEYEQDPSAWLVEDQLHDDISLLYRMAMIFIAIYQSSPKF